MISEIVRDLKACAFHECIRVALKPKKFSIIKDVFPRRIKEENHGFPPDGPKEFRGVLVFRGGGIEHTEKTTCFTVRLTIMIFKLFARVQGHT